jgi:hypothetical protein
MCKKDKFNFIGMGSIDREGLRVMFWAMNIFVVMSNGL